MVVKGRRRLRQFNTRPTLWPHTKGLRVQESSCPPLSNKLRALRGIRYHILTTPYSQQARPRVLALSHTTGDLKWTQSRWDNMSCTAHKKGLCGVGSRNSSTALATS